MAGESARDLARRQREKAERLLQSAERYEKGAAGEEATALALSALPATEWTVFHDVRWPDRKLANIDHVVVGPPGVFVIDTKNWSGSVTIADGILRHNGYRREPSVAGAAEAALAITRLVPDVSPAHVFPVMCFVSERSLSGFARDVAICTTENVAQVLLTRAPVLAREQLLWTTSRLDMLLAAAGGRHPVGLEAQGSVPAQRRIPTAPSVAMPSATGRRARRRPRVRRRGGLARLVVGVLLIAGGLVVLTKTDLADRVSDYIVQIDTPTQQPSPSRGDQMKKHRVKKHHATRQVERGAN